MCSIYVIFNTKILSALIYQLNTYTFLNTYNIFSQRGKNVFTISILNKYHELSDTTWYVDVAKSSLMLAMEYYQTKDLGQT